MDNDILQQLVTFCGCLQCIWGSASCKDGRSLVGNHPNPLKLSKSVKKPSPLQFCRIYTQKHTRDHVLEMCLLFIRGGGFSKLWLAVGKTWFFRFKLRVKMRLVVSKHFLFNKDQSYVCCAYVFQNDKIRSFSFRDNDPLPAIPGVFRPMNLEMW